MDRGRAGLTSTSILAASGEPSQARILRRASVHPRGHLRPHQHRQHHHRHHHDYHDDYGLSHSSPVGTSQLESRQCFRFCCVAGEQLSRAEPLAACEAPFRTELLATSSDGIRTSSPSSSSSPAALFGSSVSGTSHVALPNSPCTVKQLSPSPQHVRPCVGSRCAV